MVENKSQCDLKVFKVDYPQSIRSEGFICEILEPDRLERRIRTTFDALGNHPLQRSIQTIYFHYIHSQTDF